MEETKKTNKEIVVKGVANYLYFGKKTQKSQKETYNLTVECDSLDHSQFDDCFKGQSEAFIPSWYKEKTNSIGLKSSFDIPCQIPNEEGGYTNGSYANVIEQHLVGNGAKVQVKLVIKEEEHAIYPVAIRFVSMGEPRDPFEGFDN